MTTILVSREIDSGFMRAANNANWTTVRNQAVAVSKVTDFFLSLVSQKFIGQYAIWRIYYSFNTGAAIPSNAIINSVNFNIYNYTKNFYHNTSTQAVIVQTTQADATSLALADFDNLTIDDPVEAGRFNLDVFPAIRTTAFSSESLSWIKRAGEQSNSATYSEGYTLLCLRGSRDVENIEPVFIDINCAFLNVFYVPSLIIAYDTATLFGVTIEAGTIEG